MNTLTRFTALCTALWSATAAAHPQVASGAGLLLGAAHPLTGLDHVLAMIAVGFASAGMAQRAFWTLPLAFVLPMLVGFYLGLPGGIAMPYTEPLISASVLAFGVLVAARAQSLAWAVPLVAGFAAMHGLAHAYDLQGHGDASAYAAGFTLAAVTLITAGAGAALLLRERTRVLGALVSFAGSCMLLQQLL